MTFEVLRVLRERGAAIHCIVNSWENHRIVAAAERIGASWSTGFHWYPFDRHTRNPIALAQMAWDVLRTSVGLIRDARRHRATHVLVPEYSSVLRNALALILLRSAGVPVVLRVCNHPHPGQFYSLLWRRFLPPLVTKFVANSEFSERQLRAVGVPAHKITVIKNSVAERFVSPDTDADIVALTRERRTILSVGQLAPFKGTHFVVDAALELLAGGYDVQAVIVGPFPVWPADVVAYVQAARDKVVAAGATSRVHFVGECQNVLDIMRASYVLAAPIVQEETFGNVVLEAQSVGLPVVAFATGGLVELVTHKVTGYLCHEASLSRLVEGLRFFLDDAPARQRASAASLARFARSDSAYSREAFDRRWWGLFREVRQS